MHFGTNYVVGGEIYHLKQRLKYYKFS